MYVFTVFVFFVIVFYIYTTYPYQHGCQYETDCHGCTTCVNHECVDYRYGDPCNDTSVVKDLELYHAFYYGHEVSVPLMLCHGDHVAARIRMSRRVSSPIEKHLYYKQAQHLSQRIDRCGHQTWSYGLRPVEAPKAVEAFKFVEDGKVVVDDKRLVSFCKRSFDQTFRSVGRDGFLFTGDIHDMWIRDSSAQVNQYLGMLHLTKYRHLVRSVIEKQTFYILFDAYANSYRSWFEKHPGSSDRLLGRYGWVATRNFELDSGCYYFRLVYKYWTNTKELLNVSGAVKRLVEVYEIEQYHETRSTYRYPELVRDGLGSKTGYTGMVWSGFRASDDACVYHYHIPDNVFLAVTLNYVMEMCHEWGDMVLLDRVTRLRESVINGLNRFGVQDGMYCYEVDGLGNCLMMDDANIPSLLSLPYLDPEQSVYHDKYYQKTKKFILSEKNPYYFKGVYSGIGSPHTPTNHIWHLSMIMQAMLDHDMNKVVEIMDTAGSSLHESFHMNDANRFTRHWFSWADSLFSEGWWCKRSMDGIY